MPTYEYECKSCKRRFDIFQSMSEEPVRTCPNCGKAVRKLIAGGMGIIFRGSGFYVTDSRSSSSGGNGKKAEKTTTETKSEGSSGGATESTPKSEKVKS